MWVYIVLLGFVGVAQSHFDVRLAYTWLEDVNDEITDAKITFEGNVPEYVRGTYVQGGPGRFTLPQNNVTHLFDGFAKHAIIRFQANGTVLYTNTFLKGSYYNESIKNGKFTHALLMGDTEPSSRWTIDLIAGHNDNNFVKPHLIGKKAMFLQDTVVATCATDDFSRFDTNLRSMMLAATPGQNWKGNAPGLPGHLCMTATMAHGGQDPATGLFTAVMGCASPDSKRFPSYHVVFNINPEDPTERSVLAKVKLENGRPFSYMHSMGYTASHVVIVAQPMHLDLKKTVSGHVLEDSLYLGNGTLFTAVNRYDGTYRNFPIVEGFFFGHIINTFEEDGDIVLDLTYYKADENMAFIKLFARNNFLNESFHMDLPKIVRFRLTKDGNVEHTDLLPEEENTIFELPTMDERKIGKKYCVIYPFQTYANAYDEDKNSTKVGPGGATAIAKRNICTGERSGFYAAEEYPTEPKFIANPHGIDEDDGVLVGFVYNATGRSSFVQILDAKSMNRIATAQLPVRTHFFFHSSFFPSQAADINLLV